MTGVFFCVLVFVWGLKELWGVVILWLCWNVALSWSLALGFGIRVWVVKWGYSFIWEDERCLGMVAGVWWVIDSLRGVWRLNLAWNAIIDPFSVCHLPLSIKAVKTPKPKFQSRQIHQVKSSKFKLSSQLSTVLDTFPRTKKGAKFATRESGGSVNPRGVFLVAFRKQGLK